MTTRTLPKRTTRGRISPQFQQPQLRSPQSRRQKSKESQQELERKQMWMVRNGNKIANLPHFPFPRVVHYFYDLKQFPRVEGHPSYVLHMPNSLLNWNYKQDLTTTVRKVPLGSLINRQYFQLAYLEKPRTRLPKTTVSKNASEAHLFETQDKKHNVDRVIYSLELVLRKLNEDTAESLLKLDIIRKDSEFSQLLEQDCSTEEILEAVKERVDNLRERKAINSKSWAADDCEYYFHSLNHQLHHQTRTLEARIQTEGFVRYYLNQYEMIDNLSREHSLTETIMSQAYTYYGNSQSYLSSKATKQLMSRDQHGKINSWPMSVVLMGHTNKVQEMAASILGCRSMSLSEAHFYQIKSLLRRLFQKEIKYQPERTQPLQNYQKQFRNCLKSLKGISARQQQATVRVPLLDEFMAHPKSNRAEKLITVGQSQDIGGKQIRVVFLYYWLIQSLTAIEPLLKICPQLLDFISNDCFPKVATALASKASTPMAGLFSCIFDTLNDVLTKPDPPQLESVKFMFEYNHQKRVAVIYQSIRASQQPEQVHRLGNKENGRVPGKKVKIG